MIMSNREKLLKALDCNTEEFARCTEEEYDKSCPYCMKLWNDKFFGCNIQQIFSDAAKTIRLQDPYEEQVQEGLNNWISACASMLKQYVSEDITDGEG